MLQKEAFLGEQGRAAVCEPRVAELMLLLSAEAAAARLIPRSSVRGVELRSGAPIGRRSRAGPPAWPVSRSMPEGGPDAPGKPVLANRAVCWTIPLRPRTAFPAGGPPGERPAFD